MRVVNNAAKMISALQGMDLVIRPIPPSGLLMPGANDAVLTPDGVLVVDDQDRALYFITPSGLVIGKTEDIYRDSVAASEEIKHRQAVAAGDSEPAPAGQTVDSELDTSGGNPDDA